MRIKRFALSEMRTFEVHLARRTYLVVHTGGAYFRIAGRGLNFRDHRRTPALFSERYNGQHGIRRRRYLHLGPWCVSTLRRTS